MPRRRKIHNSDVDEASSEEEVIVKRSSPRSTPASRRTQIIMDDDEVVTDDEQGFTDISDADSSHITTDIEESDIGALEDDNMDEDERESPEYDKESAADDALSEEQEFMQEWENDVEVKTPKRKTARQRGVLSDNEMDLDALESRSKKGKQKLKQSEQERELERLEKARQRKKHMEEKLEKDKEETLQRLLKKQASKKRKDDETNAQNLAEQEQLPPTAIRYVHNAKESLLLFPPGVETLPAKKFLGYPDPKKCSAKGCKQIKKYQHPKTYKYACSLEHLKIVSH